MDEPAISGENNRPQVHKRTNKIFIYIDKLASYLIVGGTGVPGEGILEAFSQKGLSEWHLSLAVRDALICKHCYSY